MVTCRPIRPTLCLKLLKDHVEAADGAAAIDDVTSKLFSAEGTFQETPKAYVCIYHQPLLATIK